MSAKSLMGICVFLCATVFAESQREIVMTFLNDVYSLDAEHCASMTTYDMVMEANGRYDSLTNWVGRICDWKVEREEPNRRLQTRTALTVERRNLENLLEATACAVNKTAEGSSAAYAAGFALVSELEAWLWYQLGIQKHGEKTISQQLREMGEDAVLCEMSAFLNSDDWWEVRFAKENQYLPIDNFQLERNGWRREGQFYVNEPINMHTFNVTNGVLCAKVEYALCKLGKCLKPFCNALNDMRDGTSEYNVKVAVLPKDDADNPIHIGVPLEHVNNAELANKDNNRQPDVLEYPISEALFHKLVAVYERKIESRPPVIELSALKLKNKNASYRSGPYQGDSIVALGALCQSSIMPTLFPIMVEGKSLLVGTVNGAGGREEDPLIFDCVFRFVEKESFTIARPSVRCRKE